MAPDKDADRHYDRIANTLKGIALRLRLLTALESALRLASVLLVVVLGSLCVRQVQAYWAFFPFIYCLLALLALGLVFVRGVWQSAAGLPVRRVAGVLEKKHGWLKDDVTNALLLFQERDRVPGHDPVSEGLTTAHLQKTADALANIQPREIANFSRLLAYGKLLLPLVLAVALVQSFDARFLERSLAFISHPLAALPERESFIALEPADAVVLQGTSVVLQARVTGYVPDRLSLQLWPEGSEALRLDMASEGDGLFRHHVPAVRRSFRYQAFSGQSHSPIYTLRVVEAPDIGRMKLTLIPPAYTRLPKEVSEVGHIEALRGTIVNLEAYATKAITEGKLILNHKDQLHLTVDGDRLEGNLLVYHPGTYAISVRDAHGFENPQPVQYRIRLIPDQFPEGEISGPAEAREISGREVLPVIYSARDDFGVTTIRLIYQVRGTEQTITLKTLSDVRSAGPERFQWNLASLALVPGDRVAYRLEVWDNDSVSGPKAGYSRTFTLNMRNEREQTAREAERLQEIADALLDLLADQLERLKDRVALSGDIGRIMAKVEGHLQRTGADPHLRFDLESLQRNLASLHRRIGDLPDEAVTREMERLALLAEDILKQTRMHEVETLVREIRNRQQRLIDALRERRETLDPETLGPETLEGLLKELDTLKKLISQVMETLSRMAAQLPDEFINSPELSGLEFQDLFQELEQIREKLMAGDLAGALETAQQLLQNLAEMMAAMTSAGAQASRGGNNRLQSEMSRQTGELEKILAEQREVLDGTEVIDRERLRAIEAQTAKKLEESMPGLKEILERLQRRLPSEEKDSAATMKRLLEEGQIQRFSQLVRDLATEGARGADVRQLIDRLLAMTAALKPNPAEGITADARGKFSGLASDQANLRERTGELGQALEMFSQLFPGMDTEIIRDLQAAAGAMGQASGNLEQEDAPGAIPPEQAAIRSLARSQQGMQRMARQMARQMQTGPWGYPWGYDPRAGWYYGPWGPMPTLPQPEVDQPLERGYTGFDPEEFDPPSREAYQAPPSLREKVMQALKENIPARYRREVEKYFGGLTE